MSGLDVKDAAASFKALVEGDREKRKNQELANKMFGSGRRSSAPGNLPARKPAVGGSLASRVGVTKRPPPRPSAPASKKTGINGQWAHDLHKPHEPQRVASSSRLERGNRLQNAMQRDAVVNRNNPQFNIRNSSTTQLSIKGQANPGPFVVVATNFAAGTTSDDIKMAFEPHGEDLLSCKVVGARPQVTAEAVFTKKESAENIVAVFNNSMADGNLLYVFIKSGAPSPVHNLDARNTSVPTTPAARSPYRHGQAAGEPSYEEEISTPVEPKGDSMMMDVDDSSRSRREAARPSADGGRRADTSRRADDSRDISRDASRDTGRSARDGYQGRSSGVYSNDGYSNNRHSYPASTSSYGGRTREDYRAAAAYNARPRYQSWRSGYGR